MAGCIDESELALELAIDNKLLLLDELDEKMEDALADDFSLVLLTPEPPQPVTATHKKRLNRNRFMDNPCGPPG